MQIALALLAAGNSVRFGGNKLLYEIEGKPMYRHVVDEVSDCSASLFARKLLVTQYRELAEEMKHLDYQLIWNMKSQAGISHSIRLAVEALAEDQSVQAICFAVCDQPYLKGETLEAFINCFAASGKALGCLGWGDTLGNPAVFGRAYFKDLLSLSGDTGGKSIIKRYSDEVLIFQAARRELEDFDQI